MAEAPPATHRLGSLLGWTLRRAMIAGRIYLIMGTLLSLILALVLVHQKLALFAITYPLQLPLFASLGSLGGLVLFAGDRQKGVLEYLLAYGVNPSAIFFNALLSTALLGTLVLWASLLVGLGAYLMAGGTITGDLQNSLLLYSIPMTYASSLFATLCGMIWSTLSTPRAGMNSPVGIAPIFGIGPPMIVLYLAEAYRSTDYYNITAAASVVFVIVTVGLAVLATRQMRRERYLSQA